MKKLLIYSLVFISLLTFSIISLSAETTTDITTENTSENISETSRTYTYTSYDDLLNQIEEEVYAEIYQDVYEDIYQDILSQVDEDLYTQIYADIEASLNSRFTELSMVNDLTQTQIYDVVEIANQSVVGVETYLDNAGQAVGSAVIYDYDDINQIYYIISNYHVVEDGNNYKVRFENEETVVANLLKYDEEADIAILSFSSVGLEGLSAAILGSSSDLQKGEIILAAGHPQGFNFFNSITFGVVAGLDRSVSGETITYIQHDAAINSGNSGGPIFNLQGEVVGINVLKYADEEIEGMGFSIPIDLVKDIIANQ